MPSTDDDRLTPLMRVKVGTAPGRVAAMMLMVIVAFWSTALCLAGAGSPHVSHGCCAKRPSAQEPVHIAAPRICCAEDTPNYDATVPVAAGVLTPTAFVIVPSALQHGLAVRGVQMARMDADAGRPPGPPTYVLISIFRI